MKILLISVNRERMPYPVFPLGLGYIVKALREEGHKVEVLDLCFSKEVTTELSAFLLRFQPELIGLSLRNLDNLTYPKSISYLNELEEVTQVCRRVSHSKLVIGGSGFSLAPKELMDYLDIDFGIVGEGEEVILEVIRALERKDSPCPSPSLLVKGKPYPSWVEGAKATLISTPDRTLFETKRYLIEGGMVNVQTKRGCPFSCIYCTYPLLEGKEVRLRKVGEVVREIEQLTQEEGLDYIYFVDDIFNYPPSYTESLCREMVRRQISVRWNAFVNPGFLSEDLLKWMKAAGCVGVEFGTDSGSSRMLRNYKKSFTLNDILRASTLCTKLDIPHCHYLLLGGPGEDEQTIEESFHLMDDLCPTAIIAMLGIRIYPGTELERISLSQGLIDSHHHLLFPHFYISPALKGELVKIVREKALMRNRWIIPGLEINITQELMEGIRRFGIRGPLWEMVGRMKRPRVSPLRERK